MLEQSNPYDEKKFERKLTDAFVSHSQRNSSYEYVCRPDECCNIPAPDFKYVDRTNNSVLYIELTRITVKDLGYEKAVGDTFKQLETNTKCKVKGSFYLSVLLEQIPKMAKGKIREKLIRELAQTAIEISGSMNEGDKAELGKGIVLIKYSNSGSYIHPLVRSISPITSDDKSYLLKLFTRKGKKFHHFRKSNTTHLLLILHNQMVLPRSDIGDFIRVITEGLYGEQFFPKNWIDGVYDIILDLEWQQDITIRECYPHLRSVGMGSKSQICGTQKEYADSCIKYFRGD